MASPFRAAAPLLAAIAIALSVVGCGGSTPAEHVEQAKALLAQENLKAATIELNNALQQDPNLLEARVMMGRLSLDLGDGARAEKEYRRAVELGYAQGESQLPLVKAIAMQGDMQRVLAESHLIHDGVSTTDHAAILGIRGQAYAERREFEEAGYTLSEALELDSKSVPALVGMALLHALKRDYAGAGEWVAKALEVDPAAPDAWSVKGQIELEQGKAADAENAFTKAIEDRRYAGLDLAKRALARVNLKKFAEADADIAALRAAGLGDSPYVNYVAGVNYFVQGDHAKAAEALEASKRGMQEPYLPREYYLAATYLSLGRLEQARAEAQLVSSMAPRSSTATQLMGAVQISQSELGAATETLSKAVADAPDDVALLKMLGYVSLLVAKPEDARTYYERALKLEPDSASIREALDIAKLMTGQALEADMASGLGEAATQADDATRALFRALAAFRDGKIAEALKQAQALHDKDPKAVDPIKLIAACYLVAGQWDTARTHLQEVLQLQPNEPSSAKNLARIEMHDGNLEAARKLLSGVVEAHPGDEEAVLSLAMLETRLSGDEAGVRVLEVAYENAPDQLRARAALANAYSRAQRLDKVLELTRDLTPEQITKAPALLELRGKAQLRGGDIASATMTFEQLTKAMPDSAMAHFYYAEALARKGDMKRANEALVRSLELDPKYLPARVGEVKMLVSDNKVEQAKDRLEVLRQDFGERPEVLGIEGWFALGTGDFATASDRFARLLEGNGADEEVMVSYARSLWGEKKYEDAIGKMKAWLQARPDIPHVAMHLAGAYLSLNRESEARDVYAQVVERHPDNYLALNNLAWLSRNSDLASALAYAEKANQLAPTDATIMDTLGSLLIMHGDRERGQRLVADAAKRAPGDLGIQVNYAKVLAEQGRKDEAKQLLQGIVERAGDTPAAASAKAALDAL